MNVQLHQYIYAEIIFVCVAVDLRETRTMVKKKSADSGKSSCSVYILLGEGVGFLFFVFFFWFISLCLVAEKMDKTK